MYILPWVTWSLRKYPLHYTSHYITYASVAKSGICPTHLTHLSDSSDSSDSFVRLIWLIWLICLTHHCCEQPSDSCLLGEISYHIHINPSYMLFSFPYSTLVIRNLNHSVTKRKISVTVDLVGSASTPLGTEQVVSSIPGSVGYISHVHWAYDYLGDPSWVPSGFSGYIQLDTEIVFLKKWKKVSLWLSTFVAVGKQVSYPCCTNAPSGTCWLHQATLSQT